jgi:isoleucyl-tRNA synthetase
VRSGSVAELRELAGQDLPELDLHRPYVDEVTCPARNAARTMERVPELIDVWFDSGIDADRPVALSFRKPGNFKKQFPADYICEAVDQTRGWFYSLHAISTLLFDRKP